MTLLTETADLVKASIGNDINDLTIERMVLGLFFTGVKLSNGVGGLCYTPIKDIPEAVCCPSSAGRIVNPEEVQGMKVLKMLDQLESPEPLKVCSSIAVLNALSNMVFSQDKTATYSMGTGDALDFMTIPDDVSVAVVGAIVPVLHFLKRRGGIWWILEQDPRVLHPDEMSHFVPAQESAAVLPKADVLIVTGVTIINQTLGSILSMARPGCDIAVMGPSASMLPDAFFQRGVSVMGGVRVNDADKLLDILAVGGSGYHFFGKAADQITLKQTNMAVRRVDLPAFA